MKVYEVNDIESFISIRGRWNDVVLRAKNTTIYDTWEWLYSNWRVIKDYNIEPLILIVEDKGSFLGGVALKMERVRKRKLSLNVIEFLADELSDINTIVVDPHHQLTTIKHILGGLLDKEWDVAILRKVLKTPIDEGKLLSKLGIKIEENEIVKPYIRLPSRWETYYRNLSRSLRKNIRRRERRLVKNGELGYLHIVKPSIKHFEAFLKLHRRRMEQLGTDTIFNKQRTVEIHKNFINSGGLGTPIIHFLMLNGEPISAQYAFSFKDTYYAHGVGMDPSYLWFSPGTLLFGRTIKYAIENGYHRYDLGLGGQLHKYRWTSEYDILYSNIVLARKEVLSIARCLLWKILS